MCVGLCGADLAIEVVDASRSPGHLGSAHLLHCHHSGQRVQVAVRYSRMLLLDRLQHLHCQLQSLVAAPVSLGWEADGRSVAASVAVQFAVRAARVPGEPHEKRRAAAVVVVLGVQQVRYLLAHRAVVDTQSSFALIDRLLRLARCNTHSGSQSHCSEGSQRGSAPELRRGGGGGVVVVVGRGGVGRAEQGTRRSSDGQVSRGPPGDESSGGNHGRLRLVHRTSTTDSNKKMMKHQ